MSVGLSTNSWIIVWIIVSVTSISVAIIWGVYKLLSYFKTCSNAPQNHPQDLESSGSLSQSNNKHTPSPPTLRQSYKNKSDEIFTASSTGIEANSSDETASQTFIGKQPDMMSDPGRITLSLIKAHGPIVTSEQ